MANLSKADRVTEANRVIESISRHGRRFFYCAAQVRTAHFILGARGQILFVDDWTGKPVYVAYRGNWRQFSHGGTMRGLVEALAEYIRSGAQIPAGFLGPWPKWICGGDLWGYGGSAMAALRAETVGMPAIAPRAVSAQDKALAP